MEINISEVFNNKKICILCTCNKEKYNIRREKHENTYKCIEDSGYILVYLYSNPEYTNINIIPIPDTYRYNMIIPLEETYSNLPNKIKLCYDFFSKININCILKIDDDVEILDTTILDDFYYKNVDYTGAYLALILKDINHKIDYTNPNSKTIILTDNIAYMAGPFYWLSKRALDIISNNTFMYPWEDICVGHIISNNSNLKIVKHNWLVLNMIYWE